MWQERLPSLMVKRWFWRRPTGTCWICSGFGGAMGLASYGCRCGWRKSWRNLWGKDKKFYVAFCFRGNNVTTFWYWYCSFKYWQKPKLTWYNINTNHTHFYWFCSVDSWKRLEQVILIKQKTILKNNKYKPMCLHAGCKCCWIEILGQNKC